MHERQGGWGFERHEGAANLAVCGADPNAAVEAQVSVVPVRAFIALGSNLGDRESLLVAGRQALLATPKVRLAGASRIYETAPVGPPGQGPYLNAVLAVDTSVSARSLLDRMLEIEADQGRQREPDALRWGPRTLDLDLLLYGDRCIRESGLEVPHPRLQERPFVLQPLCDLADQDVHPRLGEPFRSLLERCGEPVAGAPWPETPHWEACRLA